MSDLSVLDDFADDFNLTSIKSFRRDKYVYRSLDRSVQVIFTIDSDKNLYQFEMWCPADYADIIDNYVSIYSDKPLDVFISELHADDGISYVLDDVAKNYLYTKLENELHVALEDMEKLKRVDEDDSTIPVLIDQLRNIINNL